MSVFALGSCSFPSSWSGIWFQMGVRPYIKIDQDKVSNKGSCHHRRGDKFIVKE